MKENKQTVIICIFCLSSVAVEWYFLEYQSIGVFCSTLTQNVQSFSNFVKFRSEF